MHLSLSPMSDSNIPLPERLRPRDLSEIIGQDHLLGEQAPLRQMIDQGHLPSIIFWGPPGVGKPPLLYCWRKRLIDHLSVYLRSIRGLKSSVRSLLMAEI